MALPRLTDEQKAAYLADSGKCPYCGSPDIEGGEVDCQGDAHYQGIVCNACEREWTDTYTLSAVDDGDEDLEDVAHEDQDSAEGFLNG